MISKYKQALLFIARYVAVYLILNTLYAFYISHYDPSADPLTKSVTGQVAGILAIADSSIKAVEIPNFKNVPIQKDGRSIISVYEGCNSINVIIVFLSFIVAFKGPFSKMSKFFLLGLFAIYGMNLLRIIGLFQVALHFPDNLYFFHKFFFTGVIYLVVFILWYFWVKGLNTTNREPV